MGSELADDKLVTPTRQLQYRSYNKKHGISGWGVPAKPRAYPDKPFNLLTTDTHFTDGYLDTFSNQYTRSLKSAYENTMCHFWRPFELHTTTKIGGANHFNTVNQPFRLVTQRIVNSTFDMYPSTLGVSGSGAHFLEKP